MQEAKGINTSRNVKDTISANGKELHTGRHTEDIQEIISKVPRWILRWGIVLFLGIILMLVAISAFVRYPDTIKGALKLESSGISIPVTTKVSGSITKVIINQGSTVKKHQLLAFVAALNNPAKIDTLIAPQDGKAGFTAIVQLGAFLKTNEEVFVIHPSHERFFGLMEISSGYINKIEIGQKVLISLNNYPVEKYGQQAGIVSYISDEPIKGGYFKVKIALNDTSFRSSVVLKNWMTGHAEIITENVSLQRRIMNSILRTKGVISRIALK